MPTGNDFRSSILRYLFPQKLPLWKILMTSFHGICGLGLPQSKILGTPMNWRSPEKLFWKPFFFFFGEHLRLCPWALGLEYSCPWPREGLSSERLSLASREFVLGKTALGLEFFLCPWSWPWPRALCPRLHLCNNPNASVFKKKKRNRSSKKFIRRFQEKGL